MIALEFRFRLQFLILFDRIVVGKIGMYVFFMLFRDGLWRVFHIFIVFGILIRLFVAFNDRGDKGFFHYS